MKIWSWSFFVLFAGWALLALNRMDITINARYYRVLTGNYY
jgi:hypothetical protein